MKRIVYLLGLVAIIAYFNSATAQTTSTNDSTICSFKVAFVSIGSGVDYKAKKELDKWIIKFNTAYKLKIKPVITYAGKEGETDYCFNLTKLKKKQAQLFVKQTKEQLKQSKLVRFYQQ